MLRELQRDLARAFLEDADRDEAAQAVAPALRPLGGVAVSRGLAIYRSALRHAVEDALRSIFPVCVALVGDDCFRSIARRHAARHVSRHPDLGRVGDDLPELLPALDFLASVPYLADVARLELALHRAADAPDPAPIDSAERLAEALSGAPDRWRLRVPPSATLLESPHPVRAIWAAHQSDSGDAEPGPIEPSAEPDRLIVWRSPRGLAVDAVESGLWPTLRSIASGMPVSRLLGLPEDLDAGGLHDDPADFEQLLSTLGLLFERGWIAGVSPVGAKR